ncbi:hypothetical protein J9303_00970 [Bacillaceae bacterium Marseille-Q3522]|nr:hypothetical protein [Bacillaceae bacterium Marseille-Q3522]
MNIIDNVSKLMLLADDELTEILLQEKYNKQNLRELVRRALDEAYFWKRQYTMINNTQNEVINSQNEKLRKIEDIINDDES